jgi:electron transport complex protein RnfB
LPVPTAILSSRARVATDHGADPFRQGGEHMRENDIYRLLQRHLDRMPVPFPATESGVEIRILAALYTPEQARIALALSMIPETVPAIHRRLKHEMSREALAAELAAMAEHGLVQRVRGPRGLRYGKTVFVVGFYEAQVNRLTESFERDVLQYFDEAFGGVLHSQKTQQMRTVPLTIGDISAVSPVPRLGPGSAAGRAPG